MITSKVSNSFFILDSAATHHMMHNKNRLVELIPGSTEVKTGNPKAPLYAKGHETAVIHVNGKSMTLKNCLFIPSISQQLLLLVQIPTTPSVSLATGKPSLLGINTERS
jgi:hypothetical protein